MVVGTLTFSRPGPIGTLTFGATGGASPEDRAVTISYTFGGLTANIAALYDINVFRGPSRHTRAPWRDAGNISKSTRLPSRAGARIDISSRLPWQAGAGLQKHTRLPSRESEKSRAVRRIPWQDATRLRRTINSVSDTPERHGLLRRIPWQDATRLRHTINSVDAQPLRLGIGRRLPWGNARLIRDTFEIPWRDAVLTARMNRLLWRDARKAPAGRGPARQPGPRPKRRTVGKLDFRRRAETQSLTFGGRGFGLAEFFVYPRRAYNVTNTATLARIIDGVEIPAASLSFGIDWLSWAWQASATFPDIDAAQMLTGNPTEVLATINGFQWRAILERPNTTRGFSDQEASANGRSLAGWLAGPYAPLRSKTAEATRTAQQLCAEELPTGWGLEWLIDDWIVPGGTFSYTNLTAIEVIQRIAAAAGAIVQADRQLRRVTVQRKWPAPPWAWGETNPDGTLPAAYIDSESVRAQPGEDFNAVLVHGDEPDGVMVRARINGTAGDKHAPDIQDRLIVDALVGRHRAIQAMADSRTHRTATLDMDLQAQPEGAGLLLPGTLLDLDETGAGYRALVIGCQVTANIESDFFINVTQQLEILIDG